MSVIAGKQTDSRYVFFLLVVNQKLQNKFHLVFIISDPIEQQKVVHWMVVVVVAVPMNFPP